MKQELGYLREELNQWVFSHHENANKTINTVLTIWSGVLVILGMTGTKFMETSIEKTSSYFIGATIFFISNLILYLAARKYHATANSFYKIAAYITVFYEKRPSKTVKVGENFSWELANSEIAANNLENGTKHKKASYINNEEYKVLIFISLILIALLSVVLYFTGNAMDIIMFLMLFGCILYIVFSIYLFFDINKNTSLRDNFTMRVRHLNTFFKYALDTGHYTIDEIKDRFGVFYEICKKYKLDDDA